MRRGTASSWESIKPILLAGEIGLETDTRKFKFGDGTTAWNALKYASQNIIFSENPPSLTTGYDSGQMWINITNGKIYFLVVIDETRAWKNVYTAGETDGLLANKLDKKPDGETSLLDENGKLNFVYIPDSIIGGLVYGGVINVKVYENPTQDEIDAELTFDGDTKVVRAIITASDHAVALDETNLRNVVAANYPGYFFIFGGFTGVEKFTFGGESYTTGDWIISQGNHTPAWAKIDNSDMVSSVNGKTGAVMLTTDEIPEKEQNPSNLYFTATRFDTAFATKASTDLSDGESILHSTDSLTLDGGLIE
jgi:hypothetical protein